MEYRGWWTHELYKVPKTNEQVKTKSVSATAANPKQSKNEIDWKTILACGSMGKVL
jgi:hypothetical protein